MQLVISKTFKSGNGFTAVSIGQETFRAITGRYPQIKETSFETDGVNNLRTFQFENAELVTRYNKNSRKTTCLVSDKVVAALPRVNNSLKRFNGIDFSQFDAEAAN